MTDLYKEIDTETISEVLYNYYINLCILEPNHPPLLLPGLWLWQTLETKTLTAIGLGCQLMCSSIIPVKCWSMKKPRSRTTGTGVFSLPKMKMDTFGMQHRSSFPTRIDSLFNTKVQSLPVKSSKYWKHACIFTIVFRTPTVLQEYLGYEVAVKLLTIWWK